MADPLSAFIDSTRGELLRAGLTRVECDGLVWFHGGAGDETLVLVHGANDQAGTWADVVPQLVGRYRLILPDLPGHGESAPAEGPLPLGSMVEALDAILDAEDAPRVTLVGNSMGGWVSLLYTFAHKERVGRLVLEDSSGIAWQLDVPLFSRTREEALVALRAVHGPDAELGEWMIEALLARATSSPMLRVAQAGVVEYLVDAKLPSLDVPTTLIWGRHDGVLPLAYGQSLARRIRGATLHVIEGAAHIPHRQRPEEFLACLTASCSANAHA